MSSLWIAESTVSFKIPQIHFKATHLTIHLQTQLILATSIQQTLLICTKVAQTLLFATAPITKSLLQTFTQPVLTKLARFNLPMAVLGVLTLYKTLTLYLAKTTNH